MDELNRRRNVRDFTGEVRLIMNSKPDEDLKQLAKNWIRQV